MAGAGGMEMVGEGVWWWWPRLWLEMTEPGLELELQKKVREDFTTTEKASTRAYSFKNLC